MPDSRRAEVNNLDIDTHVPWYVYSVDRDWQGMYVHGSLYLLVGIVSPTYGQRLENSGLVYKECGFCEMVFLSRNTEVLIIKWSIGRVYCWHSLHPYTRILYTDASRAILLNANALHESRILIEHKTHEMQEFSGHKSHHPTSFIWFPNKSSRGGIIKIIFM